MRRAKWTRLAGLCALAAVTLHGVALNGAHLTPHLRPVLKAYEQQLLSDCALGLLLVVLFADGVFQPHEPTALDASERLAAAEPGPPGADPATRLYPPRGPPA